MSQSGRYIAGTGAAPIEQITGNAGTPVTPTAGNVNIVGGNNITTTGAGSTLTVAVTGTTNHAVQVGNASGSLTSIPVGSTGEVLIGSTGADPAFGALGVNSGLTANSLVLSQGNSAFTALGAATNGQLPIGSTGTNPVLATLTAGPGISIANGAGSITISNTGAGSFWSVIGASQALVVNEGYICGSGGALSLSLPATSAVGDEIEVVLDGSTSWIITQGAGQQIRLGSTTTTLGAGGSLTSIAQGDAIRIVCRTANTLWVAVSSVGNITVV